MPTTAKKKPYYELLRDPRWQKKRLEVMSEAKFACSDCGTETETLNVHHSYYEKGLSPWEYPTESLTCLCESCHVKAQNTLTLIQRQLGAIPYYEHETVLGFFYGMEMGNCPLVSKSIDSHEIAKGVGLAFGITAEAVLDNLTNGEINGFTLDDLHTGWKKWPSAV